MNRQLLRKYVVGEFSIARLLRGLALAYAAVMAFAYFGSESRMFLPHVASYTDRPPMFALKTASGDRFTGCYLPNPGARFTLLYSHGNAEDRGDVAQILKVYQQLGFAVLAYDYAGYGTSPGRPTEQAAYAEEVAAYRYLTGTRKLPSARIIAFGHSLGGGPAAALAADEPVGGLVLESTFTSAFRVVTWVPILPFDRFDTLARLAQVHCPVLVVHGMQDDTIPFRHGQALYAAAPEPKRSLWIPDAGHDDVVEVGGERYRKALRDFATLVAAQKI